MRITGLDVSETLKCDFRIPHNPIFPSLVCLQLRLQTVSTELTAVRYLRKETLMFYICVTCHTVPFYPTALHISAGASKLCDGDLPGWAFHPGPGAGHQGDGGHVARNAGGDGNCWGMFQQLRPVCFPCLLSRAFSSVQVDWIETLQMTKCVVKLDQLMLQTAFALPQDVIRCRFLLEWQIILTLESSTVHAWAGFASPVGMKFLKMSPEEQQRLTKPLVKTCSQKQIFIKELKKSALLWISF